MQNANWTQSAFYNLPWKKNVAKIYWKCWKEDKSDPENVMTEKANLIGNWKKKLKNNQGSKEFHAEALSFIGALYSGVDAGFGEC